MVLKKGRKAQLWALVPDLLMHAAFVTLDVAVICGMAYFIRNFYNWSLAVVWPAVFPVVHYQEMLCFLVFIYFLKVVRKTGPNRE